MVMDACVRLAAPPLGSSLPHHGELRTVDMNLGVLLIECLVPNSAHDVLRSPVDGPSLGAIFNAYRQDGGSS